MALIALGIFEIESQLIISVDLGFMKKEQIEPLVSEINPLQVKINALIKSMKSL